MSDDKSFYQHHMDLQSKHPEPKWDMVAIKEWMQKEVESMNGEDILDAKLKGDCTLKECEQDPSCVWLVGEKGEHIARVPKAMLEDDTFKSKYEHGAVLLGGRRNGLSVRCKSYEIPTDAGFYDLPDIWDEQDRKREGKHRSRNENKGRTLLLEHLMNRMK